MRVITILCLLALCFTAAATVAAQPAAGPQLALYRAHLGTAQALSADLAVQLRAAAPGGYTIVQFGGPIFSTDRAALAATGVTILEYIPDFAYLVQGTAAQLGAAVALPQVVRHTPFTLADKLAPALLDALEQGMRLPGSLRVVAWPGQEAALASQLRAAALYPTTQADTATVLRAAALPAVRWVEPLSKPQLLNDVARGLMHVNAAWQARNLFGAGQTIAIADTGLDTGNTATLSPDFAGRLRAIHVLAPGGTLADEDGHGTHVAGSAAGAGVQSGAKPGQHSYSGSFAGVAPEAQLVIQAMEADANGFLIGLSDDYYTLFAQAYADGARIHSNSWGDTIDTTAPLAKQFGGYPANARRTDQFVWDHPDMAIFFAAGNSGRDGVPGGEYGFCMGGNGVVDPDSLVSPGTAKNVITVGASESNRNTGGYSQVLWVYFGGEKFCLSADPVASDPVSDNADGMAAFSSRGPTDDGRIKPDLVAPGTNIISNRSHMPTAGTLWGAYDENYVYSGGTSMSTPLVAGAGALVRQWLGTRGLTNPSAALVKAVLLNTTTDIAPGQYGTGAAREIPAVRPNSVDGWGRADMAFVSAPLPYTFWVDDHTQGLATGQQVEYASAPDRSLDVLDSAQPLRVMLSWTDPPASLSAAKQLVNDLDLTVFGPNNTEYHGNNVTSSDRTNNVEGVIIPHPSVGHYTIRVKGYNIPIQSQPYALAVSGALSNIGQLTLTASATPSLEVAAGGLITYTLALNTNRTLSQPVTITDPVPVGTDMVRASHSGVASADGSVISWSVAPFNANQTILRTLVVRVRATVADGAQIINTGYRAVDGINQPGVGLPISVRVKAAILTGGRVLFVPVARR